MVSYRMYVQGVGKDLHGIPQAHAILFMLLVSSVVVSCWSNTYAQFVSGGLLTFSDVFVSPVQSSPL